MESLLGERQYTAPHHLTIGRLERYLVLIVNRMIGTWLLAVGCVVFSALGCSMAADRGAPVSRVSVTFVQPERFTDVKDSLLASPTGTADLLAEIDRSCTPPASGTCRPAWRWRSRSPTSTWPAN